MKAMLLKDKVHLADNVIPHFNKPLQGTAIELEFGVLSADESCIYGVFKNTSIPVYGVSPPYAAAF